MPLEIRITIYDKGTVAATHYGDTNLLAKHGPDASKWLDTEIENSIMAEESRSKHGRSLADKIVGFVLGKSK